MTTTAGRAGTLRRRFLGVCLAMLLPASALADLPGTVAQVKPSVVAVGTFTPTRSPQFKFLGTGFVVGDGRQVATNAHVIASTANSRSSDERLVIALPGSGRVSVRAVERDERDPDHDLAVLWVSGPSMTPVRLGDSDAVRDGQDVAMTGFPLGASMGIVPVTHRGIIAAVTPVGQPLPSANQLDPGAVRRLKIGGYMVFQLDIVAYPGNSGSPLYDLNSGDVVGVLNMVFIKGMKENAISSPSGISYAVPISYLKALLAR